MLSMSMDLLSRRAEPRRTHRGIYVSLRGGGTHIHVVPWSENKRGLQRGSQQTSQSPELHPRSSARGQPWIPAERVVDGNS